MSRHVIDRQGAVTVHVVPAGEDQQYITATLAEGPSDLAGSCSAAYDLVGDVLAQSGMDIVHERVFGTIAHEPAIAEARVNALTAKGIDPATPVTFIQGNPTWGEGLAGLLVHAVKATGEEGKPRNLVEDGTPVGRTWRRNGAQFLLLHSMGATEQGTRTEQAEQMFDRADRLLRSANASFQDVARTWIYLANILEWYGDFNVVRNAKYTDYGIMPSKDSPDLHLPASTGIAGVSPSGAACVMDVLAISDDERPRPEIIQMTNVRQRDAFRYGSAFSRGACICEPDVTHIEISGTAAIDEEGRSLSPDDVRRQINRTLDNVDALLAQKGGGLERIAGANFFFKHAEDQPVFQSVIEERGLTDLPGVCVHADVCRDDLLFEIDGVAVVEPQ